MSFWEEICQLFKRNVLPCQCDYSAVFLMISTLAEQLLQISAECLALCSGVQSSKQHKQESQLSPSDRAMRLVSSNLANYHATVQKLLIRQVLTKPMV